VRASVGGVDVLLFVAIALAHVGPQAPTTAKADVRRVVKKHLPRILACYEQDGDFGVRVIVDFTITTTGRVTSITTNSTASQPLQRCIARVFSAMTFPRNRSATRVSYPVGIHVAGQ